MIFNVKQASYIFATQRANVCRYYLLAIVNDQVQLPDCTNGTALSTGVSNLAEPAREPQALIKLPHLPIVGILAIKVLFDHCYDSGICLEIGSIHLGYHFFFLCTIHSSHPLRKVPT